MQIEGLEICLVKGIEDEAHPDELFQALEHKEEQGDLKVCILTTVYSEHH